MSVRPARPEPRTHWVLLAAVLVSILLATLLAGLVQGQVGEGAKRPAPRVVAGEVPPAVRAGGPVVDPSRPAEPGLRIPDKHVVLTFDDGPSPWTGAVLDVLARHRASATFFVLGARAADRPELLRRMHAEGHEVGVHTYTHINLANVGARRLRAELDQTQLAVAAATGHTTNLLRPPYSSTVADLSYSEWDAVRNAGNYRVVFTDLDTKDWQRPDPATIVARGLPADGSGAVVMLHDGGGDRASTVAGLQALLTELDRRGYTVGTVSSTLGLPSAWQPAGPLQQLRGDFVSLLVRGSTATVTVLKAGFLVLAALAVLRTLLLVGLASRHRRQPVVAWSGPLPPVSVVVPAYNEELGIAKTVRSLLASDYPELEVVVVDDGSTDRTAEVVEALGSGRVRLIRQQNAGKPAALNTGIGAAQHDLLVLVDGDTVFEPDALVALVAPFGQPKVGAVSGNTKVGNRRGLLGRWQHIEYVLGFNLDRRMYDVLQCMPTVPGAIGAFRRRTLEEVGGVSNDTLAEDTDLTMAICRAGWRVVYAPDARAWTEAPASLDQLWRQRYRWCYGTMQAMWKHRHALREGGSAGMLGRRALPYLLAFQVVLPLLAPVIDVATVYSVLVSPTAELLYVWLGFLALQLLTAGYAFRLDGERLRPLWALPLQQLVYRQLMYLVVLQSVASACYGLRQRWQAMKRTGELDQEAVAAVSV